MVELTIYNKVSNLLRGIHLPKFLFLIWQLAETSIWKGWNLFNLVKRIENHKQLCRKIYIKVIGIILSRHNLLVPARERPVSDNHLRSDGTMIGAGVSQVTSANVKSKQVIHGNNKRTLRARWGPIIQPSWTWIHSYCVLRLCPRK